MKELKNKSRRNLETSNWAAGKKYYDIATSRLYYSFLQKMLFYLKTELNFISNKNSGGSHDQAFDFLESYLKDSKNWKTLTKSDIGKTSYLWNIKVRRNQCDYEKNVITKSIFEDVQSKVTTLDFILKALFQSENGGQT